MKLNKTNSILFVLLLLFQFPINGQSDSKDNEKVEKEPEAYVHLLVGRSLVQGNIENTDFQKDFSGRTFNLAVGRQINSYIGFGAALHTGGTLFGRAGRYSFAGWGLNFNGKPNRFFYNATLGLVSKYKLVHDVEAQDKIFEKEKGAVPFFEIKGGLRVFSKFSLGMSYFYSGKIKGNYKEYDDILGNNRNLIIDGTYRANFSGIQVFFGWTISG